MNNKLIFGLSLAGVLAGMVAAYFFGKQPKPLPPAFNPAANPYASGIYAEGIVESAQASGENIVIYPEVSGTVKQIVAAEGQTIQKGELLLRIDDSIQKATVQSAQATLKMAQDSWAKLRAAYDSDPGAISKESLDSASNAIAIARANVDVQTALWAKYTLSAPKDGVVMTVNAAVGGYVSPQGVYDTYTGVMGPVLVLATVPASLHVRCYVDEILVNRLPLPVKIKAEMSLRGTSLKYPLNFVRVQPFVSPKIELADQKTERVDVRVLPVIFSFEKPRNVNLYPGELVDVYIGE